MPTIYRPPKNTNKDSYSAKRKAERQAIYSSTAWKQLRETKLRQKPLCECCLKQGVIRTAQDVHHKVSFMSTTNPIERDRLAYDLDNLQSLCRECHNAIHNPKKNNTTPSNNNVGGRLTVLGLKYKVR